MRSRGTERGHLKAETHHPLDARPDPPHPRPPPVRSPAPVAPRPTPGHRPFSVSCIVVAVLVYGMMSMYWCCRLSIESGCRSVSPKEETSRNPAIGGAYGLWQAGDPCARSLATSPHDQDTEQPIQTTGPGIWRKISSARQQDKDLNSPWGAI